MNACHEWGGLLTDFALGDLDAPQAQAVQAHIAGCAACAAALSELRARSEKIDEAVRQFVAEVEPAPGFRGRVFADLEADSAPVAWRPRQVGLLAAAVALVVVVTAVLAPPRGRWWRDTAPQSPQPTSQLSAWRSPTESLLRSSTDELLRSAPRLGRFYFPLTPARETPTKRKGGKRDEG